MIGGTPAAVLSGMTPQELRNRLAQFAVAIECVTRPMLARPEVRDIALQIRRSSSGMAANHRAGGRARSHAEFTSKIGIALEESDETLYWLEHLSDCGLAEREELRGLIKEAKELVAILTTSNVTARRRNRPR
jgi:four helix bundle protein